MNTAVLTKRGAARARSGHPWIYRSDVSEASGERGDAVRVVDGAGRVFGTAFYNPESEITLRIADRRQVDLDSPWIRSRLQEAIRHRDALVPDSDALRLVHAGPTACRGSSSTATEPTWCFRLALPPSSVFCPT